MDGQMTLWQLLPSNEPVEVQATRDYDTIQKIITRVLMRGSGFEDGKTRIYKHCINTTTNKAFAELIKDEYGTGGASGFCVDHLKCIYYGYDSNGIKITTNSKYYPVKTISWLEAAERIRLLITKGGYIND